MSEQCNVYDINVNDYPRHRGETGDSERIMRAAADCTGGVLFFPGGIYEIDRVLEIRNCCSLLMHKSAVLKAVREMPYVLSSYDALLTDCYADTGKTGFLVTENARLVGCSYFNNFTYQMDDVTVIDHRSGSLLVSSCMFRKDSPHATLYKGSRKNVIWSNNITTGGMEF